MGEGKLRHALAINKKENTVMIRITINGDDFGLDERNSAAIAEAFEKELITDTTMLANYPSFDMAVKLAEQQGFTDKIGIHFNLTAGVPLTEDIRQCPRFVTDGVFNKTYNRISPLNNAEKDAIYKELTAQAEKIKSAGIPINHADSHHHIHTAVFIAPITLRVCRENGIDKIRSHRNLGEIPFYKKVVKDRYNKWLVEQGFINTKYFAYVMDVRGGELPDDTEIMVHPDYDKNGVLIDRRGMEDGMPTGYELPDFKRERNAVLRGFADLK